MKILLIKFKHIGDVLLSTPLIKNLKLNYPKARIDIAINSGCEDIISSNPNITKIHIYQREKLKKLPLHKRVIEEMNFVLSIIKEHYDMVINLTPGDRGTFISFLSKAPMKIGFKKNLLSKITFNSTLPRQGMRHTIEWDLDPIRVLKKEIFEKRVEIYWEEEDDRYIDSLTFPKEFVHFHPVSRWLFKCIDDKIAANIIDFIQKELGLKVVLTAAPIKKELQKIEYIIQHCKTTPINLSGQLTLKQTAALNKRAKAFIGVDTAIMHLAAANDIPVLAFFGPSGAFHWGPWDNSFYESGYTKKNGFQRMGKHRVIQVDWECAPCGKDGCDGSKVSDCLMQKGLNFSAIQHQIKELLK